MTKFVEDIIMPLIGIAVIVCLIVAAGWGVMAGIGGVKQFNRDQRVKDAALQRELIVLEAKNQAVVNTAKIQQTKQMVDVETQEAAIRVEEAKGISEAQAIINKTLTPQYLQHEAIQAQTSMANSPNHSTVYIPSGENGIPLVKGVE